MLTAINRSTGVLFVGTADVQVGDLIQLAGESRSRRVTAVFGKRPKLYVACRGTGPFPLGAVQWDLLKLDSLKAAPEAIAQKLYGAQPRVRPSRHTELGGEVLESLFVHISLLSKDALLFVVGFDSAWTPSGVGAIVIIQIRNGRALLIRGPQPCSFDEAVRLIAEVRLQGPVLLAIDQPIIVRNAHGRRVVEAAVSHAIGRRSGGVQPANTSRVPMFDAEAPIWRFLEAIGPISVDPAQPPLDPGAVWVLEVFPALAIAGLFRDLQARSRGLLKYNPERGKTFNRGDWITLARSIAEIANQLGADSLREWALKTAAAKPSKSLQDQLDSVVCALVGILRYAATPISYMVGDVDSGYMVFPATPEFAREIQIDALVENTTVTRLGPG